MKNRSDSRIQNSAYYILVLLMIFLPFSSWIISLTGSSSFSLIRDFLVGLIFLLSLFNLKKIFTNKISLIAVALIIFGFLTYFWREASPYQWLRGFRFTFMPLILFLSLLAFQLNQNQKKNLIYIIATEAVLLGVVALLEYFNIKIPMCQDYNATGALNETNYVGNTGVVRLKSIVAGPNALGLYFLAILGYLLGSKKNIYLWFAAVFLATILVLTFSRSAVIGLIVLFLLSLFFYLKDKIGKTKSILATGVAVIVLFVSGYFAYNQPKLGDFFTHANSSDMRIEQYRRIWNQKNEIGLLGRGMGTAGPSSINRLDGGPNHWTENIYFDFFEETGLIGILIYLSLIILLFRRLIRNEDKTGLLLISAFSISGIFINYYNGQVGIYLFWLAVALTLKDNLSDEKNSN